MKKYRHKIPAIGILCLIVLYASTQSYLSSSNRHAALGLNYVDSLVVPQSKTSDSSNKKSVSDTIKPKKAPLIIDLRRANKVSKARYTDAQILTDSVVFYHNGALLYCDSAYWYDTENRFDAYGNVVMNQGDTLFVYGDAMYYEGNINLVKVRENVRLENIPSQAVLYTDSLDYDRANNIGYYFNGGRLEDQENDLQSEWGEYQPNNHLAIFRNEVILVNRKFELYTSELHYDTDSKIASLVAPTTIVSDSGTIESSKGWYNTVTEQAVLLNQSEVVSKNGSRILRGDSIVYSKTFGEVFGNMFLQDTARKVILEGHYGYYNDSTQYAMATDSAFATEYSQKDSLYLHGDTLELIPDSTFRLLKAYHGVRFYRTDAQGVCDSMQFHSRDSILHMYGNPILWNEGYQITGDTVNVFFNDSTVDRMYVLGYSFSIEQLDSVNFNQVKGRRMEVYMQDGKMRRILVEGNVETIFYPIEKDGGHVGLFWVEGSRLETEFDKGVFKRAKYSKEPVGKITPMDMIKPNQRRLSEFFWFDYMRPLNKKDILRKVSKRAEDMKAPRNPIFDSKDFDEW